MSRLRPTRRAERGSSSVELLGFMPLLLIAALAGWQLLIAAATVTAAENAARTGSRVATRGGGASEAAIEALPEWLRDAAEAERGPGEGCDDDETGKGTRVAVCIKVPIVMPGITVDSVEIMRDAELPPSG